MTDPQLPVLPDQETVLTPIEVTRIGHMAQAAGMSMDDTAMLIGMIQETAFRAARDAATRASMTMLPQILGVVRSIHEGAAYRVADRIVAVNQGVTKGMLSNHTNCIAAAHAVAAEAAQRRPQGR